MLLMLGPRTQGLPFPIMMLAQVPKNAGCPLLRLMMLAAIQGLLMLRMLLVGTLWFTARLPLLLMMLPVCSRSYLSSSLYAKGFNGTRNVATDS